MHVIVINLACFIHCFNAICCSEDSVLSEEHQTLLSLMFTVVCYVSPVQREVPSLGPFDFDEEVETEEDDEEDYEETAEEDADAATIDNSTNIPSLQVILGTLAQHLHFVTEFLVSSWIR
jgi:hypothetical protein